MWFNKQRQVLYMHETHPLGALNRINRDGVPKLSVHENAATFTVYR